MKQLSAITQQLKDEHNSFVDQVEKLKKKNKDMQQLIDVGTEPITAFVQVARDDLTSSDVMALLRAKVSSEAKYRRPSAPPPQEEEELNVPFVVTDSTKPFMVFRPINLELSAKELSLLFDQNRLSKSAKSKLRIERIAVSEAFCKLLNYPRVSYSFFFFCQNSIRLICFNRRICCKQRIRGRLSERSTRNISSSRWHLSC